MRKPVVIGFAAAAAAALFAAGAAYASGSSSNAKDDDHGSTRGFQAAVRSLSSFDTSTEQKFTAIAPCRAVDTRGHGGAFGHSVTRTYRIGGSGSLASQGGTSSSAGCGFPTNVTAVAATITTVASSSGYLKAWANGASAPATSFMNYGTAFNASTGGVIPIGTGGKIKIFSHSGPTDVIVDITGYYLKPMWASVSSGGNTITAGSRAVKATLVSTGHVDVKFDRNVSKCGYDATPGLLGYLVKVNPLGSDVEVITEYRDGTAVTIPFYVKVTC